MYVTARARLLMEQLLLSTKAISVKDFATEFNVSERTIRRDLKEITATLAPFNLTLSREKNYLSVNGTEEDKQHFKWQLLDLTYNDYTPEERQHYILKELVKSEDTVKLITLANDLNVTVATISNDLTKIAEEYLQQETIQRQKGMGISLNATEVEKRALLTRVFWQENSQQQFMQFLFNQETNEYEEERLAYLNQNQQIKNVEQKIRTLRDEFAYEITDESYINLVMHVTVAVKRVKAGQQLGLKLDNPAVEDYPEYDIAKFVLARVLEVAEDEVPAGEIELITLHLRSMKAINESGKFSSQEQVRTVTLAQQLISNVEEALGQNLTSESLKKSLVAHLRPTLRRLNEGFKIENPLLKSIKRDYSELFVIVERAMNEVYHAQVVPAEEIGYLVLHFGAALLQQEEQISLSALVVCASGIGTSRMLVTRLKKGIRQLDTLKNVSLFELSQERQRHDYDVIVSTIDLGNVDYDYFHVSPILSEREISEIEVYLDNKRSRYRRKRTKVEKEHEVSRLEAVHILEKRQITTATILALLANFAVKKVDNTVETVEATLQAIMTTLLEQQPTLDTEALLNTLLAWEKWSGFGIMGTKLALFHTRHESIVEPIFQFFPLKNKINMPAMGGGFVDVTTIVLLLAPEKLSPEGLDVMSKLSSLLIESKATTELLQSRNGNVITPFVINQLMNFAD